MGVGGRCYAPTALPLRKTAVTHCIGGCVRPRIGIDGGEKSRPPSGFDPRAVQPVASGYIVASERLESGLL